MVDILPFKYSYILYFLLYNFFTISCIANNHVLMLNAPKNLSEPYPLSLSFLKMLKQIFETKTFVETSTGLGLTAYYASAIFEQVHSIEPSQKLYLMSKQKLRNMFNVTLYNDLPEQILPVIVDRINKFAIFWLNSDYSANYYKYKRSFESLSRPIFQELKLILTSEIENAIILIDNIRFFDKPINNAIQSKELDLILEMYPPLDEILNLILEHRPDSKFYVLGDILIAYPKKMDIASSPFVKACTVSRLYNGNNFTKKAVLQAELIIGSTYNNEQNFLQEYYDLFCDNNIMLSAGIGRYHALWRCWL